jgi:hypothetical protein
MSGEAPQFRVVVWWEDEGGRHFWDHGTFSSFNEAEDVAWKRYLLDPRLEFWMEMNGKVIYRSDHLRRREEE